MIFERIRNFILWRTPWNILEFISRSFNRDSIFNLRYNGDKIRFYLPCENDMIQSYILIFRKFFEYSDLEKICPLTKPNMVYLDVGANIGNHTVFFGKILKAKRVYSFEPQKIPAEIFRMNVFLNGLSDIVDFSECGLGAYTSNASISFDGSTVNNIGGTSITPCETGDLIIKRLDDLPLEKIDFIKIDVEGMEDAVLSGAKGIISRDKPLIWIEIFDRNYEKVCGNLKQLGYAQRMELSRNNYIFSTL